MVMGQGEPGRLIPARKGSCPGIRDWDFDRVWRWLVVVRALLQTRVIFLFQTRAAWRIVPVVPADSIAGHITLPGGLLRYRRVPEAAMPHIEQLIRDGAGSLGSFG